MPPAASAEASLSQDLRQKVPECCYCPVVAADNLWSVYADKGAFVERKGTPSVPVPEESRASGLPYVLTDIMTYFTMLVGIYFPSVTGEPPPHSAHTGPGPLTLHSAHDAGRRPLPPRAVWGSGSGFVSSSPERLVSLKGTVTVAARSGHAFVHAGASSPARAHVHPLLGQPWAAVCAAGAPTAPAWRWLPEPPAADAVSARLAPAGAARPCSRSRSRARVAALPGSTCARAAAAPQLGGALLSSPTPSPAPRAWQAW